MQVSSGPRRRSVARRPRDDARRRQPSREAAEMLYGQLLGAGVETLYDDRDERGGAKLGVDGPDRFALAADRRSRAGSRAGTVELKKRRDRRARRAERSNSALARLSAHDPQPRRADARSPLPASRERRRLHLSGRQHQPARCRARRRGADHRDERDERLPRGALRQDRWP